MNRSTRQAVRLGLYYGFVWLVMMGLFAATFVTAYIPLGANSAILHIGIALLQVVILWLVFMDLLKSSPMVRLTACVGAFWLIFLFCFTMSDYFTRPWNGGGTAMTPYPARVGSGVDNGYPQERLPLDRRMTPYENLIPAVPPRGPGRP